MKRVRTAQHTHPPDLVTVADLLAGSIVPIQMHLKVTLRPELPEIKPGTRIPPERFRELALAARQARHQPQVMEWALRSPENARLLLVDPVAAAARAGVKLSPDDIRALAEQLGPNGDLLPPGVELTGLDVTIESRKPPTPRRPPTPPRAAAKKRGGRRG